jgi:hypothetical protein
MAMQWLSQNWIGIVLIVATLALLVNGLRSGGAAGCCGIGSDAPKRRYGARRPLLWILAGGAALALYFVIRDHRAHALEYLPYLVVLACPLLHFFMHRGHGGHAQHHRDTNKDRT